MGEEVMSVKGKEGMGWEFVALFSLDITGLDAKLVCGLFPTCYRFDQLRSSIER